MASTIKVDNVQNTPGTNIINKCSTTITLGACGDTVSLASGASQTGFGRTGTVDWDTSIHTGTVTAATGKGYFVNTTSGGITVNLPAGVVGSIVAVSDYASTADSNNITISPNGSELINAVNDDYIISTKGLAVTLVYADATRGWKSVTGSDADATGLVPAYITATGGTPCSGAIVCTNYKVHTFTGPGTFCVSAGAGPLALADYLVIAGGGGGGHVCGGGGGGAGGYRESPGTASGCYTASPLGTAPAVALTLSVQGYPITIGGGGTAGSPPSPQTGDNGNPSTFSSITSAGGGGGGGGNATAGADGGSGGGGGGRGGQGSHAAGSGDTPATPVAQGFDGGTATPSPSPPTIDAGGGGGGALAVGSVGSNSCGGCGGGGATSSIDATPTARAGGGGGGAETGCGGSGGPGGGGNGIHGPGGAAGCGTINTGGGGGGKGSGPTSGGTGGSGVVIIRYKFQ